jgi:hypothetical protein
MGLGGGRVRAWLLMLGMALLGVAARSVLRQTYGPESRGQ